MLHGPRTRPGLLSPTDRHRPHEGYGNDSVRNGPLPSQILHSSREAGFAFNVGEQNRSAMGKTSILFTTRRSQQLAPRPWLRAILVPTRCAVLSSGVDMLGRGSAPFFTSWSLRAFPRNAPLAHLFNLRIKANAVPVAASFTAFVSARPTRPEVRPRSLYGLADTRFCRTRTRWPGGRRAVVPGIGQNTHVFSLF